MNRFVLLAAVAAFLFISTASEALDPAPKCESRKLKEAGRYSSCRLKAESKGVKRGLPADYSNCVTKFGIKWPIIESDGAGQCPSEADEASIESRITEDADTIAVKLSGVRFVDNGDGTVTDNQTGLMWQKTDDDGGLTDKDNPWLWTDFNGGDNTNPDGDAFLVFLHGLNNCKSAIGTTTTLSGGFGGHCDWRMPQIDELVTIYDCSFGDPCIDQSVFGPVGAGQSYLSLTEVDGFPDEAWSIDLDPNAPMFGSRWKMNDASMRAVR